MSVSKIECTATVRGKGEFTLGIYRHLAPLTVSALLRATPIVSRVTVYPGAMVCLLTTIRTGVEKQRLEFEKGDVAFFAGNATLCIFLAHAKSQRPLNPVGKIDKNFEVIERIAVGDVVEIHKPKEEVATS